MNNHQSFLAFIGLLAPLGSFLTISVLPGRYERVISVISLVWMLVATGASFTLLISSNGEPALIDIDWFVLGHHTFSADLILTDRSLLMLVVVSFISFLIHVYSVDYMAGDAGWKRYFAMLGFFTFSMQGIVLSDNLLFLFIFWELVGFSSYMLIGHFTGRREAGAAATKAFIMNRIGDAGFLVGLMIVWASYQSFSLTEILQAQAPPLWQTAAGLCIFCGIIGKSAQFPLFTWLPDAMEGPTPVSALIHAATMVAAGVYLMVRVFHLFTEDALLVVAVVGMVTTLAGALAALSQYDIKKILAYSTMSQLGLMILALGMGIVDAALIHLVTHAFFKACLFLSAGMVIYSLHQAQTPDLHFDVQDIRNMGGLKKKLPVVFGAFLFSGASLSGIPFFSGFLSKDAILTAIFMHTSAFSWLMLVVVIGVSFLTVMYTFRLIWFVFVAQEKTIQTLEIRQPGWGMRAPAVTLALCSLWLLVSWNPFDFKGWMFPTEVPASSLGITLFSVIWVTGAMMLSWFVFRRGSFKTSNLLRNAFYVDKAFGIAVEKGVYGATRGVSYVERVWIDRGLHALVYLQVIFAHVISWIDRVLVDGTVNAAAGLTGFGGKITRSFQGGNIQLYIFWAVFAIIIFIISTLN